MSLLPVTYLLETESSYITTHCCLIFWLEFQVTFWALIQCSWTEHWNNIYTREVGDEDLLEMSRTVRIINHETCNNYFEYCDDTRGVLVMVIAWFLFFLVFDFLCMFLFAMKRLSISFFWCLYRGISCKWPLCLSGERNCRGNEETQRETSQSDDVTGETWLSKMLPQSNRQILWGFILKEILTWNKRFSSYPLLFHDWLIVFCSIDMRNSLLYISIYITLLEFANNKKHEDKIFHILLLPVLEQVLSSRATRTITKVVPFSLPDE